MNKREVWGVSASVPTVEGAGVHLRRAFGFREVPSFDPFLLLDDFRSSEPEHFLKGFPWHPHRGIETITYMLKGEVAHGDSLHNSGTIGPGQVQWMTAGSGIIHQEMPESNPTGRIEGFQLWANLPASDKMMPPRYRDVQSRDIPMVELTGGAQVRVICGEVEGVSGPVAEIVTDPMYLDVSVPAGSTFSHPVKEGHNAFAYVIDGAGDFGSGPAADHDLVRFGTSGPVEALASGSGMRFLLVAGRPLGEPVAWGGPIVMNTKEELDLAFKEYQEGNFIK